MPLVTVLWCNFQTGVKKCVPVKGDCLEGTRNNFLLILCISFFFSINPGTLLLDYGYDFLLTLWVLLYNYVLGWEVFQAVKDRFNAQLAVTVNYKFYAQYTSFVSLTLFSVIKHKVYCCVYGFKLGCATINSDFPHTHTRARHYCQNVLL